MSLNVANWTDKQLDELMDMLRTADCSVVASFLAQGYLCVGSRIMTDPENTPLRVTVGTDTKTVSLSPGVFQHAGYIGQIDSAQIINILDTTSGSWGTGQISDPSNPRWSIICVKQNERLHTIQKRWFVNDTVVPNTYFQQDTNTLIDKAYYDIVVVHGSPGVYPTVPEPPGGYWTIAEIRIPANASVIDQANIYDVGNPAGSQKVPPNWLETTRVLRLEFFERAVGVFDKFAIDHDPLTGYHRLGGWHLGSGLVGATVTAPALNKLTDGSTLLGGELHMHGGAGGGLGIFGDWQEITEIEHDTGWNWSPPPKNTHVYHAETDGFVTALYNSPHEVDIGWIDGYTDSNNPPTIKRFMCGGSSWYYSTVLGNSFTMPVKKGDYWMAVAITEGGNPLFKVYWLPFRI